MPMVQTDPPGSDEQQDGRENFTITELAEEFGITARAIRFYEDKKLIHPERRGLNRVYTRRDRGRLKLILRGKRLGFSLADIKEMLDLYDRDDGQVEQLRVTLKKGLNRLDSLRQQRRDIADAIAELEQAADEIRAVLSAKGVAPL